MNLLHADAHVSDGTLVRTLDAELSARERARVPQHLEQCSRCRERLRQLERRGHRLAQALRNTDFAVPAGTPPVARAPRTGLTTAIEWPAARSQRLRPILHSRQLRIAAAIALLLGISFTVTPVRAWIVDWVQDQWTRLTAPGDPEAPGRVAPASAPVRDARVQFEPQGTVFRVELAADAIGRIDIGYHDAGFASAEVSAEGAEILVLPDGVRITGATGTGTRYSVRVPRAVARVTVSRGGRSVRTLESAQLADGVQLVP